MVARGLQTVSCTGKNEEEGAFYVTHLTTGFWFVCFLGVFFTTVLKTSLKALKRIVLMVAQVLLNKLKTTELCALNG